MLVGFNLGGRDAADSRHTLLGRGYYNLDNVSVEAVIPEPAARYCFCLAVLPLW